MQLFGEPVDLVRSQVGLDGGAQHFADRRDPILGHATDQTVYLVPIGHDTRVPRPDTVQRHRLSSTWYPSVRLERDWPATDVGDHAAGQRLLQDLPFARRL